MKPATPCFPKQACMVQCVAQLWSPGQWQQTTSLFMPHGAWHMTPHPPALMAQHPIVAKQKRRSIALRLSDQKF